MSITHLFLLLILCFSTLLNEYDASTAIVSDGVILLSLLKHWTYVPDIINSSWNASDSIPCSWIGVQCDHAHIVVSLNLSHHGILGQLGPEIGQLYHLETLVLSSNLLTGEIPSSIGNCSRLEVLFLNENRLSGKIPPEISDSRSLKKLHLYSNQLEGDIPDKLGMLSELEDLELSFNRLTGEIPISIWRIQSLKHILLHNNSLFGELPLDMTKLNHLKNISLFDNQFSGVIPQSLGISSTLVKLDFMNNKFTGNIPPNLCFEKQLSVLNLGLNQLQGGIPSDVGRCSTLRRLILRENNFAGSLPDFETNPNLQYLDISNNNISGQIPSSLENCINLTEINLSVNKFVGFVPLELGKLVNLVSLDFSHNNLEGPLPPQLSNCTKMDYFDVGFNFLNGSFPSSLRSWTGITTLILQDNHFTGGIPGFLSEFNMLRELQLGGNLFGGKIPQSMGTMQKLFYGLNLSANGLTGDIPTEIGNLKELQSLDISSNSLTGSIDVLEDLLSLIEVNISYNLFHGPLPNHLMKQLNSSPSSFMGNPHLCVSCSPLHSLSCNRTSYLKPCVYISTNQVGTSKFVIVIIELGSSILVSAMLLVLIRMYLLRRSKQELGPSDEEQRSDSFIEQGEGIIDTIYETECYINSDEHPSLSQLVMRATESLNDQYIIGRGAHGIVYKAQLDQLLVFAVKKVEFGRNKKRVSIMVREIETIGMIKHRNLITYVDYWIGKDYGLILYEYMENGSLHDILHEKSPSTFLAWNDRLKIAIGIANGLAYLHYDCVPPILHRDIKPKNILLDADMEPRVADFSIAQRTELYEHSNNDCQHRHLSAYVAGTPGYMAPENAYVVVPSGKSDVYSYGVVLLELITRKKAILELYNDEEEEQVTTLVRWARSLWLETGKIENIVDSYLSSEFPNSVLVNQVTEVLILALRCTEKDRSKRPTMKEVIDFYYDLQKSGNGCRHAGAGVNQSKNYAHQPKKPAASAPQELQKSTFPALRGKAVQESDALLGKPFQDVGQFYTLGKELGKGTYAVTYACTENSTGLEYACKSVSKEKLSKGDKEDTKREIQIMQHLSGQPNIVEFKGAYEDKYSVHVVMELCEGGELFERIMVRGHYSERAAASIFRQIINVVQTCHFMGVMHRDLKPENLLLSSKDEDAPLKAADFGLSSFIEEGELYRDIIGSYYYMAPEVIQCRHGKECDIWSVGVILYILLCGVPPFWAEKESKVFEAILQGHIDFERHPWPNISNDAKDLVREMLTQDPKKRITSAEVLEHPWMNDTNVPDNPIDSVVLSRMKHFRAMSKLRKSALMNPNRGGEALLAVHIIDGRV